MNPIPLLKRSFSLFLTQFLQKRKRKFFLHLPSLLSMILFFVFIADKKGSGAFITLIALILALSFFLAPPKQKEDSIKKVGEKTIAKTRLFSFSSSLAGFLLITVSSEMTYCLCPTFQGPNIKESSIGIIGFILLFSAYLSLESCLGRKRNTGSYKEELTYRLYHYSHTQFALYLLSLSTIALVSHFSQFTPLALHGDLTLIICLCLLSFFLHKLPNRLAQKPLMILCSFSILLYFLAFFSPIELSSYWMLTKAQLHYSSFFEELSVVFPPVVFFYAVNYGLIRTIINIFHKTLHWEISLSSFIIGALTGQVLAFSLLTPGGLFTALRCATLLIPIVLFIAHRSTTSYLLEAGVLCEEPQSIHSKRWLPQLLVAPIIFSYTLFFIKKPFLIIIPFYVFAAMISLSLALFITLIWIKEVKKLSPLRNKTPYRNF